MKRTGSMGSWVPPAETTRRLPASGPGEACAAGRGAPAVPAGPSSAARASATIRSGAGRRPAPESPLVRGPTSGSMMVSPRRRRVATFSTVAGLAHICVCMAGARTTGAVVVRIVAVSMSSARPAAMRASRSAEAGATRTSSAHSPVPTCSTAAGSSKTPVRTGPPLTAARAGAPMKRRAASVATARTSWPRARRSRMTVGAL